MTLSELTDQVSALGYDGRKLPDAAFITATNRAIGYIYAKRKVTGEYSFFAVGERPALRVPVFKHRGSEREALPLAGRVYSFYASGKGGFTLSGDGGFSYTEEFNSEKRRFFGALPDENVTATFWGELDFTVFDLVCYSERRGEDGEDIPDGSPMRRLDMKRAVCDFVAFCGSPTDVCGAPINGMRIKDSCLYYPESYTGKITVSYYRSPRPVSDAVPDAEIDLPNDVAPFLALLVCSYLYSESDPELSEEYLEQYRSFEKQTSSGIRHSYCNEYKDTNGWA